ncbi:MAG: hypothetical protein WA958_21845 [Tunicatimonas sp.]
MLSGEKSEVTSRSFLKNPTRSLLSFTVVIALLLASLKYGFRVGFIHETIWYIVAFVFTLTALSLWLGQRGGRQSPESLVQHALGGTVLRLFLSVVAIYVALRLGIADRLSFVLNCMGVYLAFLAFEVYALLVATKKDAKDLSEKT